MKVDLEVLASTPIKRKKPWPKIIWIGEQQESLLLLDAPGKRISVLFVPSGMTKKRLPGVSSLSKDFKSFNSTRNGRYLLSFLDNGEIFIWHKDRDVVKYIAGFPRLEDNFQTDVCHLDASEDCSYLLVAMRKSTFYLWIMEKGESILKSGDNNLKGEWHKLTIAEIDLPSEDSRESTLSSVFYSSPSLGHCCQLSLVFNKESCLCVTTLLLRFPDPVVAFGRDLPKFRAEWSQLEYPFQQIHPDFERISTPGVYVSSYSGSGQVLAVAANQRAPNKTTMLFISPITDTVLVGDMKGCGVRDRSKTGRHYWITDMGWTCDSLFLAVMFKNGSVCLIPRLGEPVAVQTQGCSVDMGPALYLPLHPAIPVSGDTETLEPRPIETDPMQQQFSLATHPTLPIMLFSDGFLITVLQMGADLTSGSVMRTLVLDSAVYLKKLLEQENLDMTVADAYKMSRGHKGSRQSLAGSGSKGKQSYQFEMEELSLNATQDSDTSIIDTSHAFGFDQLGAIGNMDAGKITFDVPEIITMDPNATFQGLDGSESLLKYLERSMSALTLVWKLGASYSEVWTTDVDNTIKQAVHNLCKIFTVVLDCPAVDAIIPSFTPRQSSSIQNPRVYNVIVGYRNLLQLLRFDRFNQHLIPAALRIVHNTISIMLTSKQLEATDPRIKTLSGCFSLLKHAESSLNRNYVWGQSESEAGTPISTGRETDRSQHTVSSSQLPGKRLAASWKLLYKHTSDYQQTVTAAGDVNNELPLIGKLLTSVQQVLQDGDAKITQRKVTAKITAGDKLSVDGGHTLAVEAWKEELRKLAAHGKDNAKTAQKLHAVLYTYLLRDELSKAVDFVDNLIFQASIDIPTSTVEMPAFEDGSRPPLMTLVTHRSQDSQEEELVPCIRNKSIRKTVQTMARFMAAYFSNKTLFIYHPTSARPLTALHTGTSGTDNRIIPKYQEEITNIIRRSSLTELWSTERTVEYLILSGLICETVWFAHTMGDWKTAFLLSVAHTSHREIAQHLYKRHKKTLYLPEYLTPHCILQDKLLVLIQPSTVDRTPGKYKHCNRYFLPVNKETNIDTLTKTLQDILTAGIISDIEVTPWLLMCLTEKLKTAIATLPPLVPQGFYLPAPPLYCPQPGEVEMDHDKADVEQEKELRLEISSIIQLFLVALNSASLSLPVSRWYVQELFKVQERAAQFKATTEGPCLELPEILQQYKILRSNLVDLKDSPNVSQVLSSFRDFSTFLWLLHVRDDLSQHLRQRGSKLGSDVKLNQESPVSTLGQEYVQECFQILKSAVNLLAFSHFLPDCESIQKVILSLIQELPATEDTADVLAEHFYAIETLDPEVKDKLERLVASWQSIDIVFEDDGKSARCEDESSVYQSMENDEDEDSVRKSVTFFQASPRAKTLSVYYLKQCDVVQKVFKKKQKSFGLYEEFVFAPGFDIDDTTPSNGTSAESMYIGSRPFETKQSYLEFLDRFYAICFSSIVQQESSSTRKPMLPILSQFSKQIREVEFQAFLTQYEETIQKRPTLVMATPRSRSHSESYAPQSPATAGTPQHKSLFRSVSSGVGDIPQSPVAMRKYDSEMALPTQARSTSKVKPNMTVMASRFFRSEEVLYGEPVDTQGNHWILNVNFGQQYIALQTLLDYLYSWAGKQHSLGLRGKSEENSGLKPRMRIEVPTQLVVLGLWLLDNKYSGKKIKTEPEIIEKATSETMTETLPSAQTKQKILPTVEELTERDSLTQVSNMPRSRSISPAQRSNKYSPRSRSQNVSKSQSAGFDMSRERTLEFIQSINSTHELQSEYKKLLNDGEVSSSLEVSSIEGTELQNGLSASHTGSGGLKRRSRKSLSRQRGSQRSSRQVDSSPDSQNNSAFNNTLRFAQSPARSVSKPPQTSTPLRGSRSKRMTKQEQSGQLSPQYVGSPRRNGSGRQMVSSQMAPVDLQGLDLPGQIQQIVRGELRRMLEVQHQSMINMIGALDGNSMPQQVQSNMQDNFAGPDQRKGKRVVKGALQELRNLQNVDNNQRNKFGTAMGKENGEFMDSALRMSHLQGRENVDVYRIEQGGPDEGFYPRFLKLHAEKENCRLQFPQIPREAWQSGSDVPKQPGSFDMPLLHVNRSVPAHKFPVTDRGPTIPRYIPEPGYFTTSGRPTHLSQPPPFSQAPVSSQPPSQTPRQVESPDSGIGIPLLRLKSDDDRQRQPPRFGELLPPDMVIESRNEAERKELLRERYLREYHDLQTEKATADYKRGFGEHLLQLRIADEEEEEMRRKSPTPRSHRKTKTSPRKTPRSISEQLSSRSSRKSRQPSADEVSGPGDDADVESEGRQLLNEKQACERGKKSGSINVSEQGAESDDEDATEVESVTDEEEEPIHDGYAFKKGEFEAYLALENALAKTKDTHARIQLKTALRMQRQRMMENWKKVDFATNTTEEADIGLDPVDFPPSDYVRYSEKATSITKDTGVDPIQEAMIEYNQSRQANVLPPDIYMGLRFGDKQQDTDVTGQQQDSQGRRFLNVVDLNASLVLKDLRERPESTDPQLDVSLTAEQRHLRHRIDREDMARDSYEAPVIQRPTRADELTVKMFDTSVRGRDRLSLAIMPRDSLPDSKQAIMQRLREMNSQLAAIDQMSNNIERDYKSTKLAIHTLEEMNAMMEPPTKEEVSDFDSKSPPHSLTPQPSSKSPTPSATVRSITVKSMARSATQSTNRSKKSTLSKQEQGELSAELAKVSGLSGISDIIGDMVAKGVIDLEDAGLSKQDADRLVQRGIIKQDSAHEVELSLYKMKLMADTVQKDTGRDRDELRTWMVKKRQEQMHEYKQRLDQLRERETRPFRSTHANMDQSFNQREQKKRQETRMATEKAFMTQRLEDAQELLGDILTEKPDIPVEPPAPSPRRRTDRSPGTRTDKSSARWMDRSLASVRDRRPLKKKATREISPVKKPKGILKSREASPTYWENYDITEDYLYDEYLDEPYMPSHRERSSRADYRPIHDQRVPDSRPIQVQPRPEPSVRQIDVSPVKSGRAKFDMPRLKLSLDDVDEEVPRMQQTGNTTADITEYYKAVEAMDMSTSDVQFKLPKSRPDYQPTKESPKKTYKPKPFHEIVRIQRPEATRKKPNKYAAEIATRAKYMSECETVNTSARAELTQREKEKIYGSKRLPSARTTETAPRRVKTYTERLHEMKPKEKYTTKLVPKSHYTPSVQSNSARPSSRPVKPKHKPVTYVEQLQKLNAGHHKPRGMGTKTTVLQKTFVRSHKPLHKPKTYAEQLQDLQPGKTFTGPPSKRSHKSGAPRQRPYRDPYMEIGEGEPIDAMSVISDWSMGDNVRQILYDDEESIAVGQSASYAPSEQVSDYYNAVMSDDDYTASVDIDELVQIADGGSVSSGSMMSCIDWDQVDDLIADVR